MSTSAVKEENLAELVEQLHFGEKVARAKHLLEEAYNRYGDRAVLANSLGKDSLAVWDLAYKVNPDAKSFIVTTCYKPIETKNFMHEFVSRYQNVEIYQSDQEVGELYRTDPDKCCQILKVDPVKEAIKKMNVECWITGLRCTEGRTRTDYRETEQRDANLVKLNPLLLFKEREVWQYLALNNVIVNPLYSEGYRSLGCSPCTKITNDDNERAGRWVDTSKCGGECGIHTQALTDEPIT
ncbi:MAG: phosphoadenylyl-sulfate reductase [Nitrospinota bacterium]